MAEEEPIQEYDLKKSTSTVGQLYPVLLSATGEVIDGKHRLQEDPGWTTLKLNHIDSPEKTLAARLIANFHRRLVCFQEKAEWINQLAGFYRDQGLKVEGKRQGRQGSNEIADKLSQVTGIGRRTILAYLRPQFRNLRMARTMPGQHRTQNESAREIIYNALAYRSPLWAEKVLARYEAELKAKYLASHTEHSQAHSCALRHKPKSVDSRMPIVLEPGDYYRAFIEEFPQCACGACQHSQSCEVRVYPED